MVKQVKFVVVVVYLQVKDKRKEERNVTNHICSIDLVVILSTQSNRVDGYLRLTTQNIDKKRNNSPRRSRQEA
jgi:hypothetical protein